MTAGGASAAPEGARAQRETVTGQRKLVGAGDTRTLLIMVGSYPSIHYKYVQFLVCLSCLNNVA